MVAQGLDLSDESGYSYNLYYWEVLTGAKSLHCLYCITASASVCTEVLCLDLSSRRLSCGEMEKINPHGFLYFQTPGVSSAFEIRASS